MIATPVCLSCHESDNVCACPESAVIVSWSDLCCAWVIGVLAVHDPLLDECTEKAHQHSKAGSTAHSTAAMSGGPVKP